MAVVEDVPDIRHYDRTVLLHERCECLNLLWGSCYGVQAMLHKVVYINWRLKLCVLVKAKWIYHVEVLIVVQWNG